MIYFRGRCFSWKKNGTSLPSNQRICECVYSLYYFSFLKQKNSPRTVFWNTKILKKVPRTAHYYNLTPCFRYYPINVCKAAINLVPNSRLHAVPPKCRGNDRAGSSDTVRKRSIEDLLRPVHYSTSLRRLRGCPDSFLVTGHLLQSFLITPEYGSTQRGHFWGSQRCLVHWAEELKIGMPCKSTYNESVPSAYFFLTVLWLSTLTRAVSAPASGDSWDPISLRFQNSIFLKGHRNM